MPPTSFKHANLISGQSKISAKKIFLDKNQEQSYIIHLIEIPDLVARKFHLNEGDYLIWRYYDDVNAAIVRKREGRLSREKTYQETQKAASPTRHYNS